MPTHPPTHHHHHHQDLVLEHTAVGDEGVLHAARGLPCLRSLAVANLSSSLGHLAYLSTGQRHRVWWVGAGRDGQACRQRCGGRRAQEGG